MRKGWWLVLLAAISLARGQTLTDRTGVVNRPNDYSFSGACATGQLGMQGNAGKTYRCVAGRWEREDLPQCATTDLVGTTCSKRSVCLNRTDGSILVCNVSNVWQLIAGGSGGEPTEGDYNYSQAFTAQTTVLLEHNLGTANVLVSCYDTSDIQVLPDSVDIGAAGPYDVTVNFTTAQSGRCVVNGSGNGTTGGGGGEDTYPALREDGAARVNEATYIDFLLGFDVSSLGQISLDYGERPINLASTDATGTLPISKGGTGNTTFTPNTCVRYNGTNFVSAGTDCGSGGGSGFCGDVDTDCSADMAENLSCTGCVELATETAGLLQVSKGGTGFATVSDDRVLLGTALGAWSQTPIPNCDDALASKLGYSTGTNTFYCYTDQVGAGGLSPQGPEGAIQFYEAGAFGSNGNFLWGEANSLLQVPNIEITNFYRGTGVYAQFDVDRDGTYDIRFNNDSPTNVRHYIGFRTDASYFRWPTFAARWRSPAVHLDFDYDDTLDAGDFCIRENGIDADCNSSIDFISTPSNYDIMVGGSSSSYVNTPMPDCDGSGMALNFSRGASAGTFGCQTISGGASGLANKLDLGLDGTNVQVEVDGTTVDYDPDADGTLEARLNANGSFDTLGTADESGGMSSDGKLLLTADYNNNAAGEGIDLDPDGDGTYEWGIAGTGTLTLVTGAVIPGVCAGITPAATITANDCNVVTLATGSTTISTISTCNASNLGRQLIVLCPASGTPILDSGAGNLILGADRTCSANDVSTLVCNGTNWLEVAWAAN